MTDDAYKLDDGVPVPEGRRGGRSARYPFGDMKKGQSFLVTDRKAASVQSAIRRFKAQGGEGEFTVRNTDEGVRCWRTE